MTTPQQPESNGQPATPAEPAAEQPTAEQPTAEQPTAEQLAASPPAAEQSAAAPQQPVAAPATAAPPPQVPQYAQPADPFAPIPRAPKSPWIAPQRKGAVIGISVAAGLALLLAGGVIDRVAFDDNDHPGRSVQFGGPGYRYLPGPQMMPRMPRLPPGNGKRNRPWPNPSSIPTPSETS
jgi:hypothetical protein